MIDKFTFLRKTALFADLPDTDLEQLCQEVEEIHLSSGELLFTEGSIGHQAYVIVEGQVEIFRILNEKTIQLDVHPSGEVIGEMSLLFAAPRNASGRAYTNCTLLAIGNEQFNHLLDSSPSAARVILQTVARRLISSQSLLRQNEKMAQLGVFAAGMAHELNNPAAAVQSSTMQLTKAFEEYTRLYARLSETGTGGRLGTEMQSLEERIRVQVLQPGDEDLFTRGEQEAEMERWLEDRGIEEAWNLAPQLVSTGIPITDWEAALQAAPPDLQTTLLQWVCASNEMQRLMGDISYGAVRISEIVKALKSYVFLDQSPVQEVSIHDGLENTLAILQHKLGEEIIVKREFDPEVPRILAYGSELNQVWTNLIDNAIDALEGKGEITLRTAWRDPWVVVNVADNGLGISAEVLQRLFSPFFTTKPVGKGSGLGLYISYTVVHKHDGDIKVTSKPGETLFEVWLPRDFEQGRREGKPAVPIEKG